MPERLTCPACGLVASAGSRVCFNCGQPLDGSPARPNELPKEESPPSPWDSASNATPGDTQWSPPPGTYDPGATAWGPQAWPQQGPFAASPPGAYGPIAYGYGYGYAPPQHDKGATTSLVLGIVSLLCCGLIFGAFALNEGRKARARIAASNGALTGDGMALAGMILGVIGMVGWVLVIILQLAVLPSSNGTR
jgi:hypothetical protein